MKVLEVWHLELGGTKGILKNQIFFQYLFMKMHLQWNKNTTSKDFTSFCEIEYAKIGHKPCLIVARLSYVVASQKRSIARNFTVFNS